MVLLYFPGSLNIVTDSYAESYAENVILHVKIAGLIPDDSNTIRTQK